MQTALKSVSSDKVVAYFVWLPILRGDSRDEGIERVTEFQDPRVRNYWDEKRITGLAWQQRLGLDSVAWDVYFLFDHSVIWRKDVPQPTYWMHQLRGIDNAPFLNEEEFQLHLKRMIGMQK